MATEKNVQIHTLYKGELSFKQKLERQLGYCIIKTASTVFQGLLGSKIGILSPQTQEEIIYGPEAIKYNFKEELSLLEIQKANPFASILEEPADAYEAKKSVENAILCLGMRKTEKIIRQDYEVAHKDAGMSYALDRTRRFIADASSQSMGKYVAFEGNLMGLTCRKTDRQLKETDVQLINENWNDIFLKAYRDGLQGKIINLDLV